MVAGNQKSKLKERAVKTTIFNYGNYRQPFTPRPPKNNPPGNGGAKILVWLLGGLLAAYFFAKVF